MSGSVQTRSGSSLRPAVPTVSATRVPALSYVQIPAAVLRLGAMLGWTLLVLPLFALLAPWQQFVVGQGVVSAFSPIERQQSVDAPIGGRVIRWYVQEGTRVQTGDSLLELSDIDPNLLGRLQQQKDALLIKIESLERQSAAYDEQIKNLQATQELLTTTARHKFDMAKAKTRAAEESLQGADASATAAKLQLQRLQRLHVDGIVSRRDLELARRDNELARRALNSARANLNSARSEQLAAEADTGRVTADAQSKVDSAQATAGKARSELEDSRISLAKMETDLARQRSQIVRAPRAGVILRLFGNPEGKVVKQGDPLLMLVPNTDARAVELWVDGNDAPLIDKGRHVRLQFEGWPAVQFVGWPSVAVGTFGGTVAFVDATDDGKGKFRIMVVPDPESQAWPAGKFLRQGVRTRAWVLLDQVRLGWEIWRQLNGFPPVISMEEPKSEPSFDDVARKRVAK